MKRKKLSTVTKLKKLLWAECRRVILERYGSNCYTCPASGLVGSNRHIGHFISSSVCSAALRYSLDNLRPQCYRCNIHLSGNWLSYEQHLKADGIDVEALKRRNQETKGGKYDRFWYMARIAEYQLL